jgi:hypothetical protein
LPVGVIGPERRPELDDLLQLRALGDEAGGGDPDDQVAGPGRDVLAQARGHVLGRAGRQGLDGL